MNKMINQSALDLLLQRTSCSRLQEPAPDRHQLEVMFRAAGRAPDHGQIRPWRFLIVEGKGLESLGELYVQSLLYKNPQASAEQIKRVRNMPLRAPMVIVLIASLHEHPKVPEYEQMITAGCAAHGILLAAQALGLGAFWRSGELCENDLVARGLGLQENERLIGFMYTGTPQHAVKPTADAELEKHISHWP